MAADPVEKKLDRYYDDLMTKLLEISEFQKTTFGEQKELKKEVAKVKEYLLDARKIIDLIDTRTEVKTGNYNGQTAPPMSATPNTQASASQGAYNGQGASASQGAYNGQAPVSQRPPAQAGGAPGVPKPGAPTQNLKDFLAQQVAIFDVKVLNAFIKSAKEILKSNSRTEPVFVKPIIETSIVLPIIVAGKMKLSRDKGSGSMAFCLELGSATAITRAVFMLPEEAKITAADVKDVTSEICNQICGKSKLALKSEGYNFEIELPEILQGTAAELYGILGHPKIVLHFEFNKLPFYIYFWG